MIKVTIVTVTYNAVSTIEQTILSVINQTYSNIEYIIIDGGSADGTMDIVKKYADRISCIISEPDKGIYDAMNKGIKVSTGEWINFMNSGDIFYNYDVVTNMMKCQLFDCLVIYGKTIVKYLWGTYIITPAEMSILSKTMPFCHQSTFVRTAYLKDNMFDLNYRITADYKLFHFIYVNYPNSFFYFSDIISEYDSINGVSSVNIGELHDEIDTISLSTQKRTVFSRLKKCMLLNSPQSIINLLYRTYLYFNKRYIRIK